ncbi:MAG: hypothetical protein KBC84_09430 [Proteobacteria bacterium]|nr:hypothetical protein [Pseudomonadota bacterium]
MSSKSEILGELLALRKQRKDLIQNTQLAIQQNNQLYQQKMSALEELMESFQITK